ncbi:MAG: hypothetical protein ACRD82_21545 [Blastocatellia bacterium]
MNDHSETQNQKANQPVTEQALSLILSKVEKTIGLKKIEFHAKTPSRKEIKEARKDKLLRPGASALITWSKARCALVA